MFIVIQCKYKNVHIFFLWWFWCAHLAVDLQPPTLCLKFTSACFCLVISGGKSSMRRHGEVRDFHIHWLAEFTCTTGSVVLWSYWTPAGWSVESLQEWGSYMKLAIPSTLMTCFEWWVYEFGGFFAGNLILSSIRFQKNIWLFYKTITMEAAFWFKRSACNLKCVCNDQECWVKRNWLPSMQ